MGIFSWRREVKRATNTYATGTGSSPNSVPPTDPFILADVHGYTVRLSAAAGQTLSGAGWLRCWARWFTDGSTDWFRVPDLDLVVSESAAAQRRVGWGEQETLVGHADEVVYVPDGVTYSSGSLNVDIRGVKG